jgi:bifunctional DNase/RNase
MSNQVLRVEIRGVLPTRSGCALFLGNETKAFVIYIDHAIGASIASAMQKVPSARPQSHELMSHMLKGLGARLDRVVINDVNEGVFYARMILGMENELFHQKIVELDARPSDAIALATLVNAPIYVTLKVWDQAEDRSEALEQLPPESTGNEDADDIPF